MQMELLEYNPPLELKSFTIKSNSSTLIVHTPYDVVSHDWTEIYIAHFGWIPVDASLGEQAYQMKAFKRWKYYFGNIDPFRLIANVDFYADFCISKKYERIDPFDNQEG